MSQLHSTKQYLCILSFYKFSLRREITLNSSSTESIVIFPKVAREPQAELPLIREAVLKSIHFEGRQGAGVRPPQHLVMRTVSRTMEACRSGPRSVVPGHQEATHRASQSHLKDPLSSGLATLLSRFVCVL